MGVLKEEDIGAGEGVGDGVIRPVGNLVPVVGVETEDSVDLVTSRSRCSFSSSSPSSSVLKMGPFSSWSGVSQSLKISFSILVCSKL
jgi:hypothetical protein